MEVITMAINTQGLKINIKQLREVSEATRDWPANSGGRTDIYYDMDTGDVWAKDLMDNNWSEYSDPAIIKICGVTRKHTPQWIAEKIAEIVEIERQYAGGGTNE